MNSLAGTPHYMAPEQTEVQDKTFKYSKKIDVFSLAVTWLALLEVCKGSIMAAMTGKCNALSIFFSHQYQYILFYITFIEGYVILTLQYLCSHIYQESIQHNYVPVRLKRNHLSMTIPKWH